MAPALFQEQQQQSEEHHVALILILASSHMAMLACVVVAIGAVVMVARRDKFLISPPAATKAVNHNKVNLSNNKDNDKTLNNTRSTAGNKDDALLVAVEERIHRVLQKITSVAKQGNVAAIRGTLPAGWEVGINIDGAVYYIDHNTQRTSWDHPMVSQLADLTAPDSTTTPAAVDALISSDSTQCTRDLIAAVAVASYPSGASSGPDHLTRDSFYDEAGGHDSRDLPVGWERAHTAEGVPYFINHITRRTSWCHPRTNRPSVPSTQAVYLLQQYRQQLVWLYVQRVDRLMQANLPSPTSAAVRPSLNSAATVDNNSTITTSAGGQSPSQLQSTRAPASLTSQLSAPTRRMTVPNLPPTPHGYTMQPLKTSEVKAESQFMTRRVASTGQVNDSVLLVKNDLPLMADYSLPSDCGSYV